MKRKAVVDLSETETPAATPEEPLETSKDDQGHRLGNFHNYYAFHPPSLRLDKMKDILEYIAAHNDSTTFQYCDLGCNQGDLTVAVADALEQALKKPIVYMGIDIDPVLIERANTNHKGDFRVANILQKHDLQVIPDQNLISLFSVTMWLHVNSGDGGFREALLNICERCKPQGSFLLIEPQPSKWYVSHDELFLCYNHLHSLFL